MPNHDHINSLVESLPADIRTAIETHDDDAFQTAFNNLPEMEQLRVAQVFQELQAQMTQDILAQYPEDQLPNADDLIASLPASIAEALHVGDTDALQRSFDELNPDEQEHVGQTMMILQALAERARTNEAEFRAGEGDIIAAFNPLLDAIVDATLDPTLPREDIVNTLQELEHKDWKLREPVERIWAGERNADLLTAQLDEHDATLIAYVLEALSGEE